MTLTEEQRRVEAHHDGWHLWRTDAGKLLATHDYHDPTGCGVTLEVPGILRADQIISEWERQHEMALAGAVA